jgi:zinc/manganese transport system permease protein
MIELLLWPFIAGFVLAGIHAYFGMHVLARGVVFADLALAQVAALGLTVAILAGHAVNSQAGYLYGLAFAMGGAVLFALARPYEKLLQQEAVIGIVYAVSASLGVLVLDRAPQGAEHMKQLLIGSILAVTPVEVGEIALLYGAIGGLHVLLRRPLTEVSFRPLAAEAQGRRVFLWDVLFYASFALVVTSSVRVAGVLLVFSYLIVPAVLARLLTADLPRRLALAWAIGVVLTALGLYASWSFDLPTGPAIVATFGAACALVAAGFGVRRLTLRRAAMSVCAVVAVAGFLLAAFPALDQPWLDALEDVAPPLQTVFLTKAERATREEVLTSIANGRAEVERLRRLEQDVRWGAVAMEPERIDRLRQYLAGRSEIGAGDQLVLRSLRGKARERQRFALGLPLLMIGAGGAFALQRRRLRPLTHCCGWRAGGRTARR